MSIFCDFCKQPQSQYLMAIHTTAECSLLYSTPLMIQTEHDTNFDKNCESIGHLINNNVTNLLSWMLLSNL